MRTLVTGGAGFIGSHLVDALLERGDEVVVLDDLSAGRRENLTAALDRGAKLIAGDIRRASAVREAFTESGPEVVYHLAAQIDVRRSVSDPAFDAGINVDGTVRLLEAARSAGARFVFAGTGGAIYGEGEGRELPFTERADCSPVSPYGQSKLAAEGYVELYARLHGLSAVSLRLANVYGQRQDPHGEGGVIAIFCGRLRDGKRPTVFGDGRQTRDYVYVGDVVAAFLAAAESEAGGVYNIGTGVETSVLELVERLGRVGGSSDFKPRIEPARPGEIQRSVIEAGRALEAFGWRAETALDPGLELTLASVR
jgi:UDP-glucose 4-epimerase